LWSRTASWAVSTAGSAGVALVCRFEAAAALGALFFFVLDSVTGRLDFLAIFELTP
jgi:hypothetical protein